MYKFYYINMKNSAIRNNHMIKVIHNIQRSNFNCHFERFEAFNNKSVCLHKNAGI